MIADCNENPCTVVFVGTVSPTGKQSLDEFHVMKYHP